MRDAFFKEIMTAASNFVKAYKDDFDVCVRNELVQLAEFVDAFADEHFRLYEVRRRTELDDEASYQQLAAARLELSICLLYTSDAADE